MYIAGINLSLPPPQWLEALVVLSTVDYFRYTTSKIKTLAVVSESKGGRIRPESMPSTFLGRIVTPIHGLAFFVPPVVYAGALALNQFQPPAWMARFAFSNEMMDSTGRDALRVVACATSFALTHLTGRIFEHLGDQWHTIVVGIGPSHYLACIDFSPK